MMAWLYYDVITLLLSVNFIMTWLKTVESAYLNTGTLCSIRVPPLWEHPFKRQDREGSFQYGRTFESQDVRHSSKSWLEGASLRYKHFCNTFDLQ